MESNVQYISDVHGNPVGVIVPIKLWRQIVSERETAYLLKNDAMKKRLLEAKARTDDIPLDQVRAQLDL
jgi:PHD/YefM family antitoxin component YafN of YafNO toxin-antitoxin module